MQMQASVISTVPFHPTLHVTASQVYQAYPQYVGIMRPHVGHNIECVMKDDLSIVRCADCNEDITGTFFNPRVIASVGAHLGHVLKCTQRLNEVYVECKCCNKDVVGSTPF